MIFASTLLLAGCASSNGPDFLVIHSADYARVFDAAAETVRSCGMAPAWRDRRAGIIESDAQIASSLLEPWRSDNASWNQAMENTIAFQRRRLRFEFSPAGDTSRAEAHSNFTGPDLLGQSQLPEDRTAWQGEMNVRVFVYVERAEAPGLRRSTWSRSLTSTSHIVDPETQTLGGGQFWVPVSRDEACERRLLGKVAQRANLDKTSDSH